VPLPRPCVDEYLDAGQEKLPRHEDNASPGKLKPWTTTPTTNCELTCDVKPATSTPSPLHEHAAALFLALSAFVSLSELCASEPPNRNRRRSCRWSPPCLSPSLARSGPTFAPSCVLRSLSCCDRALTCASLCRNPSRSCRLPSSYLAHQLFDVVPARTP
jgi:hypothetical protein